MKYYLLLTAFVMGALVAPAEMTKKQIKQLGKRIQIDGLKCSTKKTKSKKKYEIIEVEFSSEEEDQSDLLFRVAVEVMDGDKRCFLITDTRSLRDTSNTGASGDYAGEGYFKMEVSHGHFTKLKVVGCAFELGIMDGDTFVVFDSDYDDVKSYEELVSHKASEFPGDRCRMIQSIYVHSN